MENYIISNVEISMATGFIGIVTGIYFLIYANCGRNKVEEEAERVINTICSVVKGEVNSLKITEDDNPYELFTKIYPTLKDMNNESIDDFIDLLSRYQSNNI